MNALVVGPSATVEARLILDTGAASTLIVPKILARAGIDPVSSRRVTVTTASGTVYVPRVSVPSLSALGCERADFLVNVHDLPPSAPIDGLLGLDFLVGLLLALDMRAGELSVES